MEILNVNLFIYSWISESASGRVQDGRIPKLIDERKERKA